MIDVLPKLLIELRDDPAVDAIVDGRVRGFEPAAPVLDPLTSAVVRDGDARGPGQYVAFVVLVQLAAPRLPTVPVQRARILVQAYGRTIIEAAALWGACSDALHFRGPRVHDNGLGIYMSHDETGGTPERDPATAQPLYSGVFDVFATTASALPAGS